MPGLVAETKKTIPALSPGQIIVGNASGIATAVTLSGDATIDSSGVLTVTNSSHSHALADITNAGTMASQNANAVAITGGTINGATIGAVTPSTGAFTTINANGLVTLADGIGSTKLTFGISGTNDGFMTFGAGSGTGWTLGKNTSSNFRIFNTSNSNIGLAITPAGLGGINVASPSGVWDTRQQSNGQTVFYSLRATDSTPTGNLMYFRNAANNATLFNMDINGNWAIARDVVAGVTAYVWQSGVAVPVLAVGNGGGQVFQQIDGSGNFEINHQTTGKEVTFNESGLNVDVRMEGDTDANLFFLDASADMVGFGVSAPTSKVDVSGDIEVGDANAFYMGDPTTNNSWRITRSGNDLVIQRRELGSWVTKSTIAA